MSLGNSAPNGVLQLAMVNDNLFNEETRLEIMHMLLLQRTKEEE